jgi:hypothetical protein
VFGSVLSLGRGDSVFSGNETFHPSKHRLFGIDDSDIISHAIELHDYFLSGR